MPEIRQNLATKEWVVIATERAKRPEDFVSKKKTLTENKSARVDTCPFCPGNESQTPPEVFRISDEKGWLIRVTPNKYSALNQSGERIRCFNGINRLMTGVGFHEVVIESPLHNTTTALLPIQQVELIFKTYKSRILELYKDERIELIIPFKNHGESAGTSLEHPHSQIIALPLIPHPVRTRIEEAVRYFDDNGECVHCKMIQDEICCNQRLIFNSKYFVSFIPYAAFSPFHIWIYPKKHNSSYSSITDEEIQDLAIVMKTTLLKLYKGLGDPDYNYVIRTAPKDEGNNEALHWYVSLIPRITKSAGFELGSGMYINTSLPEKSAEFLRNIRI